MSERPDAAAIEAAYPLSPMQEGMLFHTLLRPGTGIYLMQNRYRLEGDLDPTAFVEGWRRVAARHPILRTSFAWKTQKRPLQVVHRAAPLPFDVADWRGLAADAQERRLTGELAAELAAGFDFARAPLTCFRLIRLADRTWEFVHSFHHILLDEWCTSVLMMDFLAHYDALIAGATPVRPPARPYRDYIDWLARQDRGAAEAFWRRSLAGIASPTPLGFEEARAAGDDAGEVDDLVIRLDAGATAQLTALAQRHRLTLNTLVQGAWAIVLARYSGEPEVVFGVTVAGRPPELPDVESIVGLFINTLPLRVAVPADQPLLPWLAGLFEQNLQLRQYEYTPLADIQRWSELERGQPLFHSLFVFESAPVDPALRDGRIRFAIRDVRDRVHTNYPLTIMSWPGDELPLKLSYDRDRVPAAVAARLLEHLRVVLAGMAARPEARLGELPLITAAEREQALVTWNPATELVDELSSYAARFHAQVARSPEATAVTCGERRLTYAELDRAASRVAHGLVARGVGPDALVALLDERGVELLIMILAVFKAGGAYLPLDPAYPAERIGRIARASGATLVLTRDHLRAAAQAAVTGAEVTTVEDLVAAATRDDAPAERGGGDHLAYVIFTSGSTGVPKGAMVERRGMLNNMLSKLPRLGLVAGDVIAQTASPCFDISVWQLLTALLFGGVVDIVPEDVVREPARLLDHLERRGCCVVEVVPAVLHDLLRVAGEQGPAAPALRRLRWVLPTGEALPAALARAWLARYPAVPLMNAYGPAECSDDVALHPLHEAPADDDAQVAIGRPVEHLQLYVLDRWLAPLPVGVRGELHVGGIGVGRGYLGEPAHTAAAFVPDPFSRAPGRRLYRTGDLARYRADGTLEFVGRRDHQVKIRGFRIELGEIDARLVEHPDVEAAAVIARGEGAGKRLVAYVAGAAAPPPAALRAWLAGRLPDYMVPATYVALPALPRSANGKIDRRALPAPAQDAAAFIAPRTATEALLAGIWAELLAVPQVSVEASFFELGGHSLLLTQVLARLRKAVDVEVPLRALFDTPTVAAQAGAVDAARARPAAMARPPLARHADGGPQPLSFAQERLWFLAQLEPAAAAYNVPAALRVRGPLDLARLERSLAAAVARHDALRTRFVEVGGKPVALVDGAAAVPVTVVDLRVVPDEARAAELQRCVDTEAARPFALDAAPLLRVHALRVADDDHVVLVVLHHLIADGWSLDVLVGELAAGYVAGGAPTLPALPVQPGDHARWQRSWLQGAALDEQLAFWRQQLGSGPPVLQLPTDLPRPEARTGRGARVTFALPAALTSELAALARGRGVTSFMLLLAAWQVLLARRSGQGEFTVGTPVAGRTDAELEGVVGCFVNTLVLPARLAGNPRVTELLARTRDTVLAAQAHQDLPFDRLVQALRPTRDLGHTPLFQVMFSLQDTVRPPPAFAGLEVQPFDVDPGSAQFDLALHMVVEGDRLTGALEYSTDLFVAATAGRLADELCALLVSIVGRPDARLDELALPAAPVPAAEPAAEPAPVTSALVDADATAAAEAVLTAIWAEILGRDPIGRDDDFFELGGDSILGLQVVARARHAGLSIAARHLFQHPTIARLAAAAVTAGATAPEAEQGLVTGAALLTPIQRRFFARALANPHHWNQALLLEVPAPLDGTALTAAVEAVVRHHDALRLRFAPEAGGWRQHHAPPEQAAGVHITDLRRLDEAAQRRTLEAHAVRWQASLDLTRGPVLRVVGFDLGADRPARLLLVAHHLVVDGVSWRIVLEDLQTAYDQARRGEAIALPAKSTSFQRWAEALVGAGQDGRLDAEAATWLDLPWDRAGALAVDDVSGERTVAAATTHSVALSVADTAALLTSVPEAYRTRIDEILLTALALALARWTGRAAAAIEVEGHGREEVPGADELDVSRTVGWFTSAFPVVLEVAADAAPGDAIKAVKEQLRRVPRRGLAYGVVRELAAGPVADRLRAQPTPAIAFNYLGQWDQVVGDGAGFAAAAESPGPEQDARSELGYELEIDAAIHGGRLEATWRYSARRYHAETVTTLAAGWLAALEALIRHCTSPDAGGYTPSDFPDVALSTHELDAILERMD